MKAAVIYIVLLFFADYSFANNTGDTLTHKANDQKTVSGINKKINKINKFIERRSKKRIKKLNRIERKIFEELCKIDEVAAEQFYLKPNLNSSYTVKNYRLDTLKTLEKYYIQNHGLSPENSKTQATEELLKDNANQQANYRSKRKLIELLSEKYPSISKHNKIYRKEIFYFNQQVSEYSNIFKKTNFISKKNFEKLFKDKELLAYFINRREKMDLSKINKGTDLHTNQSVSTAIIEKIAQFNLGEDEVKANVMKMKSHKKVLKHYPGLINASDIPEFSPNLQKSKRFKDRLSIIIDVSNMPEKKKSTNGYTVTTGILYKINNKIEAGFGFNYNQPVAEIYKLQTPAIGPYAIADHIIKGKFSLSINYSIHLSDLNTNYIEENLYIRTNNHSLLGGIKIYQNNKRDKIFHSIYYDFFNSKYKTDTLPIIYKIGYKF